MAIGHPTQDSKAIAGRLQGQTLRVPNLGNLFTNWPLEIHSRQEDLVKFSEGITRKILETEDRIVVQKKGKLARYVSMWFPHADFDRLKTVCTLNDWMHAWDDSVDNDQYDLARDFKKASQFRHDTLVLWRSVLELSDEDTTYQPTNGVYRINCILPEIGSQLRAAYNKNQLRRFYNAIEWFVTFCAAEHEIRLSMRIPYYDEYIALREGSGGAPPMIEIIELANNACLPEWIFSTPEMRIMKQTLVHAIVLVNDIFSLKKELATGCLINSISAQMKTGETLDQAVEKIVERIRYSVMVFDEAAKSIADRLAHSSEMSAEFEKWLHGARSLATGTWKFSVTSERYTLSGAFKPDGSLEVRI